LEENKKRVKLLTTINLSQKKEVLLEPAMDLKTTMPSKLFKTKPKKK
jgi:hypothetical protein